MTALEAGQLRLIEVRRFAEFDGDDEAQAELIKAAGTDQFAHAVTQLRVERVERRWWAEAAHRRAPTPSPPHPTAKRGANQRVNRSGDTFIDTTGAVVDWRDIGATRTCTVRAASVPIRMYPKAFNALPWTIVIIREMDLVESLTT